MRRHTLLVVALGATLLAGAAAYRGGDLAPRAATAARLPDRAMSAPSVRWPRAGRARVAYFAGLDELARAAAALEGAAAGPADSARTAFRAARDAYKGVEGLAEYWSPQSARLLNGPALDRADEEPPFAIEPPTGMQVIEEALFPDTAAGWRDVVREQGALVRRSAARMREVAAGTEPTDGHLFEAARLEIARVLTLGLAGFDAGSSGDAAREGAVALRGVRASLAPYVPALRARDAEAAAALDDTLLRAAAYLDAHRDADRLDRLAFLVEHANPAARAVDRARRALDIALPTTRTVWSPDAATLFEAGAFDASALAPPYAPTATPALVALGRDLFFDPRLSGDGSRSCASCHQPERAFTDGQARRAAMTGAAGAMARNTPTVTYVGLQPGSFYDQRTTYLEDQVTDVIGNREEMRHSVRAAAIRLREDASARARFAAALGGSGDTTVSALRLRVALAAYLRSLQPLDSRFDRATRGDTTALSAAERRGFTVFMGRGKCATCHFMPLFNGATPPALTEAEPEVIGVPARAQGRQTAVDADPGRMAVDRVPTHRHAFKTPTLRNVALTAPYMHNGIYRTLEEVVDFYDRGGGAGSGASLSNQTLPADSLHLTAGEKRDLVAFLGALTDAAYETRRTVARR